MPDDAGRVTTWPSGDPVSERDQEKIALLHAAGCPDPWPLLGRRDADTIRCRLCNVTAPARPPS